MDPSEEGFSSEECFNPSGGLYMQPFEPLDAELGWVMPDALFEILVLDIAFARQELFCPRCGSAFHSYGEVQLCSNRCPENMRVGKASN